MPAPAAPTPARRPRPATLTAVRRRRARTWSAVGAGTVLLTLCSGVPALHLPSGPRTDAAARQEAVAPASVALALVPPTGTASAAARRRPRTAAERFGWTRLVASDDFSGTRVSTAWRVYASRGHAGKGIRARSQVRVRDGVLRIVGTKDGTTGGMSWKHARKYGRWEVRARFAAGCGCYHPVLILRPTVVPWPRGGEIDYVEVTKDPQRRLAKFFLHYSAENKQLRTTKRVDMTTWHTYAVEWTPDHVSGFIDGVRWFRTTRKDVLPPGPMHQTIQLDWFPRDGAGGTGLMEVDWARMYAL